MEVILIQDLANLGFKNDIVKVRDGYGRNYVIEVKVKANEDGKIFGTVTTQNISDALKAQEILIDKKVITIAEPIKQVGEYTAQARLHREVKADIKLNVVAE